MSEADEPDRMTSSAIPGAGSAKTIVLAQEWRRYTKHRDTRSRDQLILAYSPIVKYTAGRMILGMPAHVELADLVSYGLGGLIQAVERFEPDRGIKFESYAYTRIRGAIVDGMRAMDWVPRRVRDEARMVDAATQKLTTRLQRLPTDAELAEQLSMATSELEAALQRIGASRMLALDEVNDAGGEGDSSSTLADSVVDPRAEDPADAVAAQDLRDRVAAAIEQLPDRQRLVMGLRYQQELSLAEIGEVMGVSESRACQLHTTAARNLRALLTGEPAPSAA